MMNIHSKYDNAHKNVMYYTLKCTNNHVIIIEIRCYHPNGPICVDKIFNFFIKTLNAMK